LLIRCPLSNPDCSKAGSSNKIAQKRLDIAGEKSVSIAARSSQPVETNHGQPIRILALSRPAVMGLVSVAAGDAVADITGGPNGQQIEIGKAEAEVSKPRAIFKEGIGIDQTGQAARRLQANS
jgi:hypothetical protein